MRLLYLLSTKHPVINYSHRTFQHSKHISWLKQIIK